MAGYAQSVGVLDRHHVVGLEVRVRDIHKRVDVVLGEVHHVAVDGADVSVKIIRMYIKMSFSHFSPYLVQLSLREKVRVQTVHL